MLKPIGFERFLQAINKLIPIPTVVPEQPALAAPEDIFVKSDGKLIRLMVKDILYVESLKNYLLIHTQEKNIIIYSTMLNMEEQLAAHPQFMRIHKSYLINKNHIAAIQNNIVSIKNDELPIGAVYRSEMMKRLGLA